MLDATYNLISPEDLKKLKLWWDKLIKKITRVGIDLDSLPEKNRFLQFVSALKVYGHSTAFQMHCIIRAAEIVTNVDYDIAKIYETLASLTLSQNPTTCTHRGSAD